MSDVARDLLHSFRMRQVSSAQPAEAASEGSAKSLSDLLADARFAARLCALDAMQLGVTIVDRQGVVVYANEAQARMHRAQRTELVGRPARLLSPSGQFRALSPADLAGTSSWARDTQAVRADGALFPVRICVDVIRDENGRELGVVTTCDDITERKRAESELEAIRTDLGARVQERTRDLLEANARLQTEVTERVRVAKQLAYDAFHDRLTGLPNRALFCDRLDRALTRARRHPGQLCAVLSLELDRFEVVRDSLGERVADNVLVEVARRVGECVRVEDTVARSGDGELLVLLESVDDASDATRVAGRCLERLATPVRTDGETLFLSGSVGITLSSGGYSSFEDMIRDSHIAMLKALAEGGGVHRVFDREMHERAMTRLRLETALREALKRHRLSVQYQPIVTVDGGRVEGFEALARWNLDDGTSVPPSLFITVAEQTGMILELDQQILRQACATLVTWRARSGADQDLYVSVNLSSRQLARPDFVARVAQVLAEIPVPPSRLRFEITESSIMDNTEGALEVLKGLRELGVSLSIDDFGTGYSSLSHLHRFPVDTLKIDRSFVSGGSKVAWEIVGTIMALARNLGLVVVAEGVESPEQLEAIRELGCERYQGFLFSRPLDAADAERLLFACGSPKQA